MAGNGPAIKDSSSGSGIPSPFFGRGDETGVGPITPEPGASSGPIGPSSGPVGARSAAGPAPASDSTSIPDFGSRYRVEGKLGEGGMGAVYKAYDLELDRMVALKVIRSELMANTDIVQRFKQELLLASRISHKHVLRIHDLGEGAGVKFISMAYIEGRSLAEVLQQHIILPLDKALDFGKQICQALAAAHQEGVVHRDLKPQNILIDQAQCVYVSDFGLAKSLEADALAATAMTAVGQVLGTPRYMSPEQVECSAVDGRSDIYSFGLMLYEMVTGDLPFQGNTLQLMLGRVQSMPRNPTLLNSKLPPYLAGIIMRCLEKDVARRYQTFDDVLGDLEAEHCTPAGKTRKTKQITLPHFSAASIIVTVLALAVLIGGGIAVRRYMLEPGTSNQAVAAPTKFVAVLPFRDMSQRSGEDYLAEGISEALYTKLFGLKDVQVASPSDVQRIKNVDDLANNIGRALGVKFVIRGTVESDGDRLVIGVKLDDAATGKRLLQKDFRGVRQDILITQDQVYSELLKIIEGKPSDEGVSRTSLHQTENYAAYEQYLKGKSAMRGQLDVKNVKNAIHFYELAIKEDPSFAIAYSGIADANLRMWKATKQGDWAQQALSAAQAAQSQNDNLPEVHFALGSAYIATGKTAEAVSEIKRALELAPNSDDGYRRLGDAFRAGNNKQEALAAYEKAIELNRYYWFNYNVLGSACVKFSEYPRALEAFKRVTELEPGEVAGYQNLSAVYLSMGDYEKAVPILQKSLEIKKHSVGYSNLGTAYFYLKQYDKAVEMFNEAVNLDRAGGDASEIHLGNLADSYRWAGKTQEANATYDQAIAQGFKEVQVNPKDASRMGRIALYYAKKGDSSKAADLIRRARAIDANDATLIYTQAVVQWLNGRQDDALNSLGQALDKKYSLREIQSDPELSKLVALPQFTDLVKQVQQKSN